MSPNPRPKITNLSLGAYTIANPRMELLGQITCSIYEFAHKACKEAGLEMTDIHRVSANATLMALINMAKHPEFPEKDVPLIIDEAVFNIVNGCAFNGLTPSSRITLKEP